MTQHLPHAKGDCHSLNDLDQLMTVSSERAKPNDSHASLVKYYFPKPMCVQVASIGLRGSRGAEGRKTKKGGRGGEPSSWCVEGM